MENQSEDNGVMSHIRKLNEKEQHLYGKENLTDDDISELHRVKSELDQYWDLLHQRRGLRDAGENPDKAEIRSDATIKNYKR